METKLMTEMKTSTRILVVTNDGTVFRSKGVDSAFNMFGGRVTEVKSLVARLDTAVDEKGRKLCDVSYGVITTRYGFVPGNYVIDSYPRVMSNKKEYEFVNAANHFVEQTSYLCRPFDKVIFCIPKDMFAMFLEADQIDDGKLIAVTCPEFKEECEKRGWTFLERKGARVGSENADEIERLIRELCKKKRSKHRLLMLEKPSLERLSSGVVAYASSRREDPVAWDYYRQGVGPAGCPHGHVRPRGADGDGDVLVGARLPVGDPLDLLEDRPAESGDSVIQRKVELLPLAAQVFVHLAERLRDHLGLGNIHLRQVGVWKVYPGEVPVSVLAYADHAYQRHPGKDATVSHTFPDRVLDVYLFRPNPHENHESRHAYDISADGFPWP